MSLQQTEAHPPIGLALIPIVLTLAILGVQIFYFGDFTPHIPLAIGIALTTIVGLMTGLKWDEIEKGAFHVIAVSFPAVSVLLLVGMIVGTWIAAGTVPTLIYYGLALLSPQMFLAAGMLLCSIVSLALGTSWGTVGTVGLALMGIGEGFGIPAYWTAAAVVSGAFFGDKISPLSDTTNLAPAVTDTNLFDHIRNMLPTTVPAMLIALVIYFAVGFNLGDGAPSFERIDAFKAALENSFNLSPWLMLPALLVVVLAVLKMPAIPSLFIGVLLASLLAMYVQGASIHDIFTYANYGYSVETGVEAMDKLMNRGGIQSMMWTISLILIALGFGGALERTGCLAAIISVLTKRVKSFAGVQTSAILTSVATNTVAGDPYLSIALPGRMFRPVYDRIGYSRLNLARATEEGGTIISPLIPWNAGGAFVITALGLSISDGNLENLLYIPLSFACWLAPVFGIFYAWAGWFSPKAEEVEELSGAAANA
ncbi:Na+/H+ antiporter NhaC [Sulfitobacter sp. M57]|uniref:Na+/H+ antiporter NhaC n=1 Tax=unclassified Sulfitobacter TaxID=196795 RepID=UPI0023E25BEE|nr:MULTISPECIES: Na+/H+ antiporter NhaC [unclassified Sulfitobacter]MDF3416645.1 Na+/H+ antiporter NhaC [Sulfitobacter sp. KE5]MDF3424125.1 Na+/H+ antiporter NhaC [Sulfitobacter sp. KE43]MDF3435190.1 Na+/H+ antiporter NhaC [Sulfitobacter sp. KE42]MDF3460806.1 Na+/H+ antiporter NhaC [Sulfitobacter sp. S74]MDF3464727.1 Na+/H+ antiporter NhaC [Sulfitobacter sp. Ks18]